MRKLVAYIIGGILCLPVNVFGSNKKTNILFIMTDQQRYDMLSCAGNLYAKTPSLDKLAEGGTF